MSTDRESYAKNCQKLRQLMEKAGISSLKELSRTAGVSEWQLSRLQHGLLPKMPIEILVKLAEALQVSVNELLSLFCPQFPLASSQPPAATAGEIEALKQEYQNLQQQLERQQANLLQEFQRSSLEAIESWLLQWPTAAAAAEQNPQLPALRLLPLTKPLSELLKQWGVEAIASVGEETVYDPQWHQLMEGTAEPGERVKVRYIGYRQGEKLLYRAKVSPVPTNEAEESTEG